jgi:hypothetical protein
MLDGAIDGQVTCEILSRAKFPITRDGHLAALAVLEEARERLYGPRDAYRERRMLRMEG